jgi:hypothetical protein
VHSEAHTCAGVAMQIEKERLEAVGTIVQDAESMDTA